MASRTEGAERMKWNWRGLCKPAYLVTLVAILVVDLWSKAWAFGYVATQGAPTPPTWRPRVVWIEPYLMLAREENPGTLWGLGQEFTGALILLRFMILMVLLWLVVKTGRNQRARAIGLGLVSGGALGNLYDNLFRSSHAVRDFIDVYIPLPWLEKPYNYPVFNVADSSVLIGAIVLFLAFGRATGAGAESPSPETSSEGTESSNARATRESSPEDERKGEANS